MKKGHGESLPILSGIRVAHVTSVPFFLVTQLKRQMEYLRGLRMHVVMATSRGPELEQIVFRTGFEYSALEIKRRPALIQDIMALIRLVQLCIHQKLQVIHSTTPKAGLLTAVAAWLTGVPVRLHTFTGQQWVTMSGPLRLISRWSDRAICRLNTRVYADSPSQRQFLINEGIVCADRIGVIGAGSLAGVDVRRFNQDRITDAQRENLRRQLGIAPGAMIITFIGRITQDKGVNELVQAVHALLAEGRSFDLVLIGPLDSALETGRGSQASTIGEQLQGNTNIHMIGYTEMPERYLAITDVLCLPSYREGFGTVVIEAAAMGVPTVGTRITGLSDAVADEVTGLLVPPRDADALAAALRRLIADHALRRRLGEAARQRCLDQYDSEVINRCLAEEYARLLAQVQSSRTHGSR